MISAEIDMRKLERDLRKAASAFGEENQTAIARWGVAVCRRLVVTTQAWGDDKKAKDKQDGSILKDINRAVFSVSKMALINQLRTGKLGGLTINGNLVIFDSGRVLKTAQEVNRWVDSNRTDYRGRVRRMSDNQKAVAPESAIRAAAKIRSKQSGKAKGAWIGAGQEIGRHQKSGSRITIGKNFASYAHKFKSGGSARMQKSTWDPIGIIINSVKYVSSSHVLKKSDMQKALNDAGKLTIKEYEKRIESRLKKLK